MDYCLNMCDVFLALYREYNSVDNIVLAAENEYKQRYSRLYLGSYFCDIYFINNMNSILLNVYRFCRNQNKKINLVLPVFSESNLEEGKTIIRDILTKYNDIVDEVTVNDIGMLFYMSRNTDIKIYLGRLMQKVTRDIRYRDFSSGSVDFISYSDKFEELAKGIEFDVCAEEMNIDVINQKVVVHRNYTYATTGRICSFSAINKGVWSKFSDTGLCDQKCNQFFLKCSDKENNIFYRVGKTVFYNQLETTINTNSEIRWIDFAFDIWKDKHPLSDYLF